MSFTSEFKEFALKGNVMDLAIGVIIGAAFGKIIDALVTDIIMPPISLLIGDKGFTNFYFPLSQGVRDAMATNATLSLEEAKKLGPVIAWGNFLTVIINFLIIALVIFMMVKAINSAKRKEEVVPAPIADKPAQEVLLTEIRDLLKK